MKFYETPIFTEQITSLLSDESYAELQEVLIIDPQAGDLIQRSGGLRKMRWKLPNKGKSGGIRVIYYMVYSEEIFFLLAYPKSKQEDLTKDQVNILRHLVETNLNNE